MDVQHYTVLNKGDEAFALLTSLENPYNLLLCKVLIKGVEYIDSGNRINYHCEPLDFLNSTKYLDVFLQNNSFRLINTKTNVIKDITLRFKRTKDLNINYNLQYKTKFNKYQLCLEIPMVLKTKEEAMELIDKFEDATVRYFNNIVAHFDTNTKYRF